MIGLKEAIISTVILTTPLAYSQDTTTQIEPETKRKELVENARQYMGIEYEWNGRLTKKFPGLDCLGLLFRAYDNTYGTNWWDISVYPSKIVKYEQMGTPVEGLDGVFTKDVDIKKFEEGDVIYLLSRNKINDEPLANINGQEYWPWHTGMYSDKENNLFIEANPGRYVLERNFDDVLNENEAIFVTRTY